MQRNARKTRKNNPSKMVKKPIELPAQSFRRPANSPFKISMYFALRTQTTT